MDARGNTAAFTGAETVEWAGHRTYQGFSVAGNMLVGEETVLATAEAYQASMHLPLAERLLRAVEAGQAAGGDKRGHQSAALLVVTTEVYPYLDIRVDDHPDPLVELRRLYAEAGRLYLPFKDFLVTGAHPTEFYSRTTDADATSPTVEGGKQ